MRKKGGKGAEDRKDPVPAFANRGLVEPLRVTITVSPAGKIIKQECTDTKRRIGGLPPVGKDNRPPGFSFTVKLPPG